jgi:hypothetical protein
MGEAWPGETRRLPEERPERFWSGRYAAFISNPLALSVILSASEKSSSATACVGLDSSFRAE